MAVLVAAPPLRVPRTLAEQKALHLAAPQLAELPQPIEHCGSPVLLLTLNPDALFTVIRGEGGSVSQIGAA